MNKLALVIFIFISTMVNAQSWPLHIEAESFTAQSGGAPMTCNEGGQCVGYINPYNWLEYQVNLPKDSVYKLSVRVAGSAGEVDLFDSAWNRLGCIYFPRTSTDQTFTSASTYLYLKGGNRRIRLQFRSQVCSINWFEVTPSQGLYCANYFESDWQWATQNSSTNWKACRSDSVNSSYLRSTDNSKSWIKQTARPASLLISNEYPRSGKSCARFELAKSDSSTWPYLRSEIYTGPCPQSEMWFGFSTMSPTYVHGDGLPHIIFQLHGTDDPGEAKSPNCALRVENDSMYIKVVWASAAFSSDATKDGEIAYNVGKYKMGAWDDWVLHIKFAYDNTGILEVWRNETKVVNRINLPNAYNDVYRSYPKFGIYKWGWVNPWFSYSPYDTLVVYYDNLKIGGATSNYNEVSPAE